jgi:ion channel-forming bestrophin family protein
MVNYNPKDWFTFIFRFHKADTFRKLLPMIIAIAVYAGLVAWLESELFHLTENSRIKNLSIMHSMLTFVISMLLVFRTNTAYERWWEGRKLWGGLVNSSRNLALKLHALLPKGELDAERKFFATMIPNYAHTLKNHLRGALHPEDLDENDFFKRTELRQEQHNPNYVARRIFEELEKLKRQKKLTQEEMLYINAEVVSFTDVCGACERIKNTPIPFSYSAFLKKFIFFFIMSLPLSLALALGYGSIQVVAFIFYVLTSLELIAEEIEDPFGKDSNDLPTEQMSKNIRKSVHEIFGVE